MTQEDKNACIAITISFAIAIMLTPLFLKCSDTLAEKDRVEYESKVYLIEIVDKYDHLGSSWHLVGGRATEQEYHIIYKATPLTEEAKKNFYYTDRERDDEVDFKTYRKYKVGDKYKSHEFLYIER